MQKSENGGGLMNLGGQLREEAYQHFVPEAIQLLEEIQLGLIELNESSSKVKINDLVRAAHTLKGGTALLQFKELEEIARRLEKVFRCLLQENISINFELVEKLWQAYECLRVPLITQIETGAYDTQDAIAQAEPIFTNLEAKLGNQQETELPTAKELGIDVTQLMLTTQVEQTLEELADILEHSPKDGLVKRVQQKIEVLLGLGEFLELAELINIGKSNLTKLKNNPESVEMIGQKILKDFRSIQQTLLASKTTKEETKVTLNASLDELFGESLSLSNLDGEDSAFFLPTTVENNGALVSIKNDLPNVYELKPLSANLLVWLVEATIFIIPARRIEEIVLPETNQTIQVGQQRFLQWQGRIIPIYHFSELLEQDRSLDRLKNQKLTNNNGKYRNLQMLVIEQDAHTIAVELEVERLLLKSKLSIKPLSKDLQPPSYFYGLTSLEDDVMLPAIALDLLVKEKMPQLEQEGRIPQEATLLESFGQETGPSILVVDDSNTWRNLVSLTLKQAGYQVIEAQDGQAAVAQLDKNPPVKLVVCDVEMPNMNGYEFLCYRRQTPELKQLPVIMLSTCNSEHHRRLAKELGASSYHTKPYNQTEFLSTVATLLALPL